jgi:hypothetical protein
MTEQTSAKVHPCIGCGNVIPIDVVWCGGCDAGEDFDWDNTDLDYWKRAAVNFRRLLADQVEESRAMLTDKLLELVRQPDWPLTPPATEALFTYLDGRADA